MIEANCFAAVICKKAKKKSNKFNPQPMDSADICF